MTEERFEELKEIGYFTESETFEKDGEYFTEEVIKGEVYVRDNRIVLPINEGWD